MTWVRRHIVAITLSFLLLVVAASGRLTHDALQKEQKDRISELARESSVRAAAIKVAACNAAKQARVEADASLFGILDYIQKGRVERGQASSPYLDALRHQIESRPAVSC